MTYKLKATALVAMAICAVSALGASTSQAAEFHCESYPCYGHGTSTDQQFTVTSGIWKCAKNTGATFTATATATSTTLTVEPTYPKNNCTAFGVPMETATNGCDYLLHAQAASTKVTMDVVCPAGKVITVKPIGLECTIRISPQTGLEGITIDNEGSGVTRDIKATISLTGIHYIEEGAECAKSGTTTYTNGVIEGSLTLLGYKDAAGVKGAQQGIWIS